MQSCYRLSKPETQHCNAPCRLMACRGVRQCLINTSSDRQSYHNWGLEACFEMRLRAVAQRKHNLWVIALCRMIQGRIALLTNKKPAASARCYLGGLTWQLIYWYLVIAKAEELNEMHLSCMEINQTIPAVTPQILLCILAAKAEGSGKIQQQIIAPCANSRTKHVGTDDGEYAESETAKWTLLALRSKTKSLREEGRANGVTKIKIRLMSYINDILLCGVIQMNIANEPALLRR